MTFYFHPQGPLVVTIRFPPTSINCVQTQVYGIKCFKAFGYDFRGVRIAPQFKRNAQPGEFVDLLINDFSR